MSEQQTTRMGCYRGRDVATRGPCVVCRLAGTSTCADPTCCNYFRTDTQDADERKMLRELADFWKNVPGAPDMWKKEPTE